MKSMMPINSRLKKIILFTGSALISLSLMLFLSAVIIGDFGQPGRGTFFNSWSGILTLISFVLLGTLALTLLIVVVRTWGRTVLMPPSAQTHPQKRGPEKSMTIANTSESGNSSKSSEQINSLEEQRNMSVQILTDTAGELRTSVGAIQEELEDMMEDEDPAEKEHMQSLLEETGRLKKIIDGMEQLTQAQTLAHSLRKESLELEPLLKTVLERIRNTAPGRDVTFTLECEQGLTMIADSECLRQIMENLLDNAAKAVKNAGSVILSAEREGDEVVFSVADTGIGIRARHLSHIYERFFRGTGIGIGMGLTIVKELVDACGGTIEVQTEPGKGSVFTIHISAL
jgi:two-component system, OmpR family, sensor histidine kinase BaeS